MQIAENIDTMFEYMPFKSRWSPVDNFIQLGGVVKCFQVKYYPTCSQCARRDLNKRFLPRATTTTG